MQLPLSIKGLLMEYVSVARCAYKSSFCKVRSYLNDYEHETSSRIGGVLRSGWQAFTYMSHRNKGRIFFSANDNVYVLKNNTNSRYRKCIIGL